MAGVYNYRGDDMYIRFLTALLVVLFSVSAIGAGSDKAASTVRPTAYRPERALFKVETTTYDWEDQSRQRQVPVRMYYPTRGAGRHPLIVFSHGLGGSRDNYSYLGKHWASRGYIVVHVEHEGSDADIRKGANNPRQSMRDAANSWENVVNRSKDISFVLDRMEELAQSDPLFYGRLVADTIGLAGHSFGAHTTLTSIGFGEFFERPDLIDDRIDAAIVMSSTVGEITEKLKDAYRGIDTPVFHMTTRDDRSPISGTAPEDRRLLYEWIDRADQYFLMLSRGPHMVFAGPDQEYGTGSQYSDMYDLITISTTAFWDAYLRNDRAAKVWLRGDGFAETLQGKGKLEFRDAKDQAAQSD